MHRLGYGALGELKMIHLEVKVIHYTLILWMALRDHYWSIESQREGMKGLKQKVEKASLHSNLPIFSTTMNDG